MINESKFDKNLVNIYHILSRLNYSDLQSALDNKLLYRKTPFEMEIGDQLDYSKLNLRDYLQ